MAVAGRDRATATPWGLLAIGWAVVAGGLLTWLSRADAVALREQLESLQFWNLQCITGAFAITSGLAVPAVLRIARRERLPFRWIAAAAVLALTLTVFAAPRTNRIYFDEHIYQHIGQNLRDLRLAQMCNNGFVEAGTLHCVLGEYNKQPSGYPQLLSLVYRLFGVGDTAAFWLNAICAALLVLVVGLATGALFAEGRAAGFAALVMALIPEQLRWSNTAAAEPSAALMIGIAVLAAIVFARERSAATLAWVVAAGALAVQFRPESLLCLPLVALVIATLAADEYRRPRIWAAALGGLLLCSVLIAHLIAVRHEPWGASGARMSFEHVAANLRVNAAFFVADRRFPVLYAALAVAGLAFTHTIASRIIAASYFLLFWGIFLIFYAGSYDYGADVRYSLMAYPPLAMLAGAGLSAISRFVERRTSSALLHTVAPAVLVAAHFLFYLPYVRSIGEEASSARADVAAARAFRSSIPGDAIVLTHTPSMFLLWGTNAAQMSIATTAPDVIEGLKTRYRGGVYLHWGFWCNVSDPVQTAFCTGARARFPGQLVREEHAASFRFALYRLF